MARITYETAMEIARQHLNAGDANRAIAVYREILQDVDPAHQCDVLCELATAFYATGARREALALLGRSASINLRHEMTQYNVGVMLAEAGQFESATSAFRNALAVNPANLSALNNLGMSLTEIGKTSEAVNTFRAALKHRPDAQVHSNLCFMMQFDDRFDSFDLLRECRAWDAIHAGPAKPLIRPHDNDRTADRGLRIGYISPDFRMHCQRLFMIPLLSNHNRAQV